MTTRNDTSEVKPPEWFFPDESQVKAWEETAPEFQQWAIREADSVREEYQAKSFGEVIQILLFGG